LAKGVARERIKTLDPFGERAAGSGQQISKIISPCGLCSVNLKSASERSVEFSSFVLGKLRGISK
jgi:hypothetical protein